MREFRLDALAVLRVGLSGNTEHARHRRSVDVGVEYAHVRAFGGERKRKIRRRGGLADATLARGDRDDVLHVRHRRQVFLHLVREQTRSHADRRIRHARFGQFGAHLLRQSVNEGLCWITEHDADGGLAAIHAHTLDRARSHEVLTGMRIDNFSEQALDLLFGGLRHKGNRARTKVHCIA